MRSLIRSNKSPAGNLQLPAPLLSKPRLLSPTPTFVRLPDGRVVVAVEVDISSSMGSDSMQTNQCLGEMQQTLTSEPMIGEKVDVQVVTAGDSATMVIPATPIVDCRIPEFSTGGFTPLGEGASMSLEGIKAHVERLRQAEISVVSSILVVISDGGANDDRRTLEEAKRQLRAAQDHLTVIPLLSTHGDKAALEDFCGCECLEIAKTDIPTLFRKLTSVIRIVSTTSPSKISGPSFVRDLMFGDD